MMHKTQYIEASSVPWPQFVVFWNRRHPKHNGPLVQITNRYGVVKYHQGYIKDKTGDILVCYRGRTYRIKKEIFR